MSEHLSFALVLLVGIASVASLLFLSGTSATGNVIAPQGHAVALPPYVPCAHVACPGHAPAYAMQEPDGGLALGMNGQPICLCLPPQD